MSSSEVSLLQMPKDPMKHILDYLDFPSILVLRKVCHDLRNFIDDTKPASHLTEIIVDVKPKSITSSLRFHGPSSSICIQYVKNGKGCLIKNYRAKETVKGTVDEDFVTVFCKDFDIILRHQKTVLEKFGIHFNSLDSPINEKVLESVKNSLISMSQPLQVKSLHMGVHGHNEILAILPYIDPKALEHININDPFGSYNTLNLDEIGQLEQWKQADELTINGFQLLSLSLNLKHFSRVVLISRKVSVEELILLKEMFLSSSTLTTMAFYYNFSSSTVTRQGLIESFGQPFLHENRVDFWYFRILDANQLLRIHHRTGYIDFNRIEHCEVLQNAIIQN